MTRFTSGCRVARGVSRLCSNSAVCLSKGQCVVRCCSDVLPTYHCQPTVQTPVHFHPRVISVVLCISYRVVGARLRACSVCVRRARVISCALLDECFIPEYTFQLLVLTLSKMFWECEVPGVPVILCKLGIFISFPVFIMILAAHRCDVQQPIL